MLKRILGGLVCLTVPVLASAATVEGTVEDRQGRPIEGATVAAAGQAGTTDEQGAFALPCESPCALVVRHPRFVQRSLTVELPRTEPLRIVLPALRHTEDLVVTASPGLGDAGTPVSIASSVVRTDELSQPPAALVDVVEGTPGVAENGQGGLFQVYSVRGVSRQRVTTLIAGMRVVGERRAGVSASFLDPLLMEGAEVLRGPSSTYYGAGALGGVVHVFPARTEGWRVDAGLSSFGGENYQAVRWGDGKWSVGWARRSRDDDTAADGTPLNAHFTQQSATVSRRWVVGSYEYELLLLPSAGREIGKVNTDFPDRRVTDYPEENHVMARFSVDAERGWKIRAYTHPNDLRTEVLRPGDSLAVVENEAWDLGLDFSQDVRFADRFSGRFGADYFGRRGVEAIERETFVADGSTVESRSLDGSQDELAGYATLEWRPGTTTLQIGTRFTWQSQDERRFAAKDDTAWTGFAGLAQPLGGGVELTANVGTGRRFASLSERFFTGTTGRGSVKGNPDLRPERSVNTDLGLRWTASDLVLTGQLFQLKIDDYIERIDLETDVQGYVNLTSGRIRGIELGGVYIPGERWQVEWSGASIDGEEDGSGRPLADVPSDRLRVRAVYGHADWHAGVGYQRRWSKNDPGSGERAIPSADLLSAWFEFEAVAGLRLSMRVTNLLDEVYFNSADDKTPPAHGRAFSLGLTWNSRR